MSLMSPMMVKKRRRMKKKNIEATYVGNG